MANLTDSPHFATHDDYYTPRCAWERVSCAILTHTAKDKIIWEACMLGAFQSKSMEYLQDLSAPGAEQEKLKVVGNNFMDCLIDQPKEWDIIITNIPFDKTKKIPILKRFVELDKPFIIIMNSMNTFTKYFHEIFKDKKEHLQIITPSSKINFDKLQDGVLTPTKNCSFYCVYVCYKVNLSPECLWVD